MVWGEGDEVTIVTTDIPHTHRHFFESFICVCECFVCMGAYHIRDWGSQRLEEGTRGPKLDLEGRE